MTSLFVEYLLPRCILNLLTNSKLIQIEKSEKNYLIIMRPFRLSKLFSAIIIENEEEVVRELLTLASIDLHLIFEKSSFKNQFGQTWFFVYSVLDFYCLCSLQKSSSK